MKGPLEYAKSGVLLELAFKGTPSIFLLVTV